MGVQIVDVPACEDERDVALRAVQSLSEGRLVAIPTESSYAIAALSFCEQAVRRLDDLRAPAYDRLELAIRSLDEAIDYVPNLASAAKRLARRCWPGPLAIRAPDAHAHSLSHRLPVITRQSLSPDHKLDLRVPSNSLVSTIQRFLPGPIVLSAAKSKTADDAREVADFHPEVLSTVDLILNDGKCRLGHKPTLVEVVDSKIHVVREGVITESTLRQFATYVVLIVCTGNTCRSPMAELLMRKRLAERLGCDPLQLQENGVTVHSAGTTAMAGGRATPEAVDVMKERGLDLSEHESQPLSERIARFADVILTMTRSHRKAVIEAWPDLAQKTFLVSKEGMDVPDPIGGPPEAYRRCANQIDSNLEPWAKGLDIDE